MIPEPDQNLTRYMSQNERFYQLADNDSFLKYKSLGSIKLFVRNNEQEIKKIFSESKLDCIIIYEVESAYSAEMQFVDFDSLIVIVDSEFNVVMLDHQKNNFDTDEFERDRVKKILMDKINERFIEKMLDINYLKKK